MRVKEERADGKNARKREGGEIRRGKYPQYMEEEKRDWKKEMGEKKTRTEPGKEGGEKEGGKEEGACGCKYMDASASWVVIKG